MDSPETPLLSAEEIIAALWALGVEFVGGEGEVVLAQLPPPPTLMASLVQSNEARLRLALIPLLLVHPSFASAAPDALIQVAPDRRPIFKLLYTAARLLQAKYRERLVSLVQDQQSLPALYDREFDLSGPHERRMAAIAEHHRRVTGQQLNWLGSYDHAARRLLERRARLGILEGVH